MYFITELNGIGFNAGVISSIFLSQNGANDCLAYHQCIEDIFVVHSKSSNESQDSVNIRTQFEIEMRKNVLGVLHSTLKKIENIRNRLYGYIHIEREI